MARPTRAEKAWAERRAAHEDRLLEERDSASLAHMVAGYAIDYTMGPPTDRLKLWLLLRILEALERIEQRLERTDGTR